MAEKIDLIAENREDSGKGASRRLRRSGKIPAIIYGAGEPAEAVVFDQNSLLRQMENESFFSSVLTVQVNGKEQAAIVKDLQRHPALETVLHVDLQRIVADGDADQIPFGQGEVIGRDDTRACHEEGAVWKVKFAVEVAGQFIEGAFHL